MNLRSRGQRQSSYPFMVITIRGPHQTPLFFLSIYSSLSSFLCQYLPSPMSLSLAYLLFVINYLRIHVKYVGLFCIYVLIYTHIVYTSLFLSLCPQNYFKGLFWCCILEVSLLLMAIFWYFFDFFICRKPFLLLIAWKIFFFIISIQKFNMKLGYVSSLNMSFHLWATSR